LTQPQTARVEPAGTAFEQMNKQVEFILMTDIFIVREDPTLIRLSSYNAIVIATVSADCQSPPQIYAVTAAGSPTALPSMPGC
jgi:hypothetical protein